jgi:phosphatidyl-myo-inositol alpha-mannosyltransferase
VRIAILCPYSLSKPGGVQGQATSLARTLRGAGHEAVVIAPLDEPLRPGERGGGGPVPSRPVSRDVGAVSGRDAGRDAELDSEVAAEVAAEISEGVIGVGRSVPVPANGSIAPVTLDPLASVRAVRAVRHGEFDVLHFHEPLAPGPSYACLVACTQPKVGTFHRAGQGLAYRIAAPFARLFANRLDERCAVSPQACSTARGVLGGTYEVVGNGVETGRFATAAPWPTRGPTVLFIARHEKRKGLAVLLEAWDRLCVDRSFDATLWVAGEGPETEFLRRRHPPGPNLEWLGKIGDDEKASRLAGADVLCAPSLGGESFGMVLVEAMAARTAVVGSDIPGYAFVAGSHALLVPPGDVEALSKALERATGDARMGVGICAEEALAAAFEQALGWSMERLAQRYVGIYERLLS